MQLLVAENLLPPRGTQEGCVDKARNKLPEAYQSTPAQALPRHAHINKHARVRV